MRAIADLRGVGVAKVLRASVTPLASIFGSGFLIIVPLLERSMGRLAVVGVVAVCAVAWLIGTAIRHNIAVVEPRLHGGELEPLDRRLEWIGDIAIAIAYVISVALYLRIMAEYLVRYVSPGSESAISAVACAAAVGIVAVGVLRGFQGLDLLERIALIAVLILTTVLGVTFLGADVGDLLGSGIHLPPGGNSGIGKTLLLLGGLVITVQGFETVRYLADEYDAPTRIWASRVAQLVAASIYIGFVIVATPLMGLGTHAGVDETLIDITERVAPLLTLPLVLCAVLSQLSAATADTAAASGNLHEHATPLLAGHRAYLFSGVAAVALILTIPTLTIVMIASRAFAAYYGIQCVVAARSADGVAGPARLRRPGADDGGDHPPGRAGGLRASPASAPRRARKIAICTASATISASPNEAAVPSDSRASSRVRQKAAKP